MHSVAKLDGRTCSCRLNNPEAHTFCDNCNVLLAAAMDKAGVSEYCDASVEVWLPPLMHHFMPMVPSETKCKIIRLQHLSDMPAASCPHKAGMDTCKLVACS